MLIGQFEHSGHDHDRPNEPAAAMLLIDGCPSAYTRRFLHFDLSAAILLKGDNPVKTETNQRMGITLPLFWGALRKTPSQIGSALFHLDLRRLEAEDGRGY